MKLYVCYGTFMADQGHPCGAAHKALKEAGHDPEVVHALGWRLLPDFLNFTPGRREVKRLTGRTIVPLLVTDDGQLVQESDEIAAWALDNPA